MPTLCGVDFGTGYDGLLTVGYTVFDDEGATVIARTTSGVTALGGGAYQASVSLPDGFIGTVYWDTEVAGSVYAVETVDLTLAEDVAAIKAKTDLLGTAGMTYPALVQPDGVTFEITAGYDYQTAEGRRLVWTSDEWPDLTGVTAVEMLTDRGDVFTGVLIAYGGSTQSVGVALTAEQTATLRGQVSYQVRATHANTHKTDLVPRGTIDARRLT